MTKPIKFGLTCLIACFLAVSLPARACVACTNECPNAGLCVHVRGSGYTSCEVACGCPIQNLDCMVTIREDNGMAIRPCSEVQVIGKKSPSNQSTTLGLAFRKQAIGIVIAGSLPGSPGYLAGLRRGDRILKVDGMSAAYISLRQLASLERAPAVALSVIGRGGARQFVLRPISIESLNRRVIEQRTQSASLFPANLSLR